ncbi:MAG: gluconate 2-dehydrogenase subunit 3 family protein [Saprospiraceae bacterium]|nr:gluconate 2-dehydrogenase subunit 3 family protein [Saprospiraceae bacterium]
MDRREAIRRTSLLLGGAISSSALAGVLSGCQATANVDWTPVLLDQEQARMLESIADCMLPATDTPGALDVGVPAFVDLMLKEAYNSEEQARFTEGLQSLTETCQEKHQKPFHNCSVAEQTALLTQLENESDSSPSFIRMAKELTLLGYFTSETIMNDVLNYNPVPGKYEGCVEASAETMVGVDNNIF